MMNKQEIMIKEYEELRSEIKQKIGIQNSLITFMITAVIAVLTFAIGGNNSILYFIAVWNYYTNFNENYLL